jgi:hypothetical protein
LGWKKGEFPSFSVGQCYSPRLPYAIRIARPDRDMPPAMAMEVLRRGTVAAIARPSQHAVVRAKRAIPGRGATSDFFKTAD